MAKGPDIDTLRGIGTWVATAVFAIMVISFRPFTEAGAADAGGDAVNQLGFGAVGAVAGFCLLALADRRVVPGMLGFWWSLLIALFFLSVAHALDPSAAFRTALFTLIGVLGIVAVLVTPRDADSFSTVLAVGGLLVVGICYVGLVIYPDIARHTADSVEPEHAGLWRGAFSHKNIAGPVMACLSLAGLYLVRRGWRASGGTLLIAALIFLANTGSKTTTGLVPVAVLLVMGPSLMGLRRLVPLVFGLTFLAGALATVGIVLSDPLWNLTQAVSPGLTYTGRTALWSFLVENIAQRPWLGFGYESFWGTPVVQERLLPFDSDWDIRGIVHGHNGYLDIAVLMGLPTLAVALIAFLVVPAVDFLRVPRLRENVLMADFFMMLLMFTALNALLESFFFRRVDPVWLFFVMAVFGLRYVSRFAVAPRIAPAATVSRTTSGALLPAE